MGYITRHILNLYKFVSFSSQFERFLLIFLFYKFLRLREGMKAFLGRAKLEIQWDLAAETQTFSVILGFGLLNCCSFQLFGL